MQFSWGALFCFVLFFRSPGQYCNDLELKLYVVYRKHSEHSGVWIETWSDNSWSSSNNNIDSNAACKCPPTIVCRSVVVVDPRSELDLSSCRLASQIASQAAKPSGCNCWPIGQALRRTIHNELNELLSKRNENYLGRQVEIWDLFSAYLIDLSLASLGDLYSAI